MGISAHELQTFVSHGDLRRLYHGVYADGRARLPDRSHLYAALLAVGEGAWLAGRSAAALWELEAASLTRIHVAVVADHTPRHNGLNVTRSVESPDPRDIRQRHGCRVSSVPRLLVEAAAAGTPPEDLLRLLEAAARRRSFDPQELDGTLERLAGRRGAGILRKVAASYLPQRRRTSTFEQSFDRWLAQHPEIPTPLRNVRLGPWELDCYWPQHNLVMELDGRDYHIAAADFERDRLKDAWLQRRGKRILRVTGARWDSDRHGVHEDLLVLLELRRRIATDASPADARTG